VTAPVVDALVLAAGASRRLAPHNKLLARDAAGRPLIARTLAGLAGAQLREIVVVLGHQHAKAADALAQTKARLTLCPDYAEGQSHSLRAGLLALMPGADAVLVCLGDMPLIGPDPIAALIAAWCPGAIVAPAHAGHRGNPVLWDRLFIPEMLALTGDTGARALLRLHAGRVRLVDWPNDAVLRDADTPLALRSLPGGPWRAEDGTLI
jgi:molybdenum cofactor cytidylyltransferase